MNEQGQGISEMLTERIAAGDFPSAVYVVAERGEVRLAGALGDAVREPSRHAATHDTIYDLASLTKPLITGLLCAKLVGRQALHLDGRVAAYLPEFEREDKRRLTLRQLLTHTSGLPAWRPLYLTTGGRRERVLDEIAAEELEYESGTRVLYSDLGFITLGLLLERVTATRLSELARREIFEPLGLKRTFFNPDRAMQTEVAACESAGNAYERQMCSESATRFTRASESSIRGASESSVRGASESSVRGASESSGEVISQSGGEGVRVSSEGVAETSGGVGGWSSWRESLIWGEVHDGNAHFLGGEAGHAGLFSTARETLRIAEQFLPARTRLLRAETCALFRTNMTEGLNEARSLAWQLAATPDSTAGPALAPDSFGHLGFTGTSCWIDPTPERILILLTNRTHARSLPFVNINSVRRRFHTLAVEALESRGEA